MGAMTLNEALGALDPENEYLWTEEGLPRMEAIERLLVDRSVSRKDVTDADPEFCRDVARVRCEAKRLAEAEAKIPNDELSGAETSPRAEAKAERDNDGLQKERKAQTQEVDPEEKLRADILAVSGEIETLLSERVEVDKAIDQLKKFQARLQVKSFEQHSATADMKARMAYIHSQNEQRNKRYEKGRKVLAALGKDGLNPMSRLDQAMRRKTGRGTRRPPPRTPGQ